MKNSILTFTTFTMIALALVVSIGAMSAAEPPPWAYGFEGPPQPGATAAPPGPAPTDTTPRSLPGVSVQFTRAQIANRFGPADWFPGDHPQMPDVVAHGKQSNVWACSLCHYPNGKGRAENAGISGLSTEYFIHTMNDFKNGNRKSADPRKANSNLMAGFAKNMTDDEIKAAAEYFGAIKWTPWIKVVEAKMVPKAKPNGGLFVVEGDGKEMEPLGNRILEVPVNGEATEILRDPHSPFTAYVPVGSLKKGEALATKSGKTTACGICHGPDLKGLGPAPSLAGRSPSYLVRQMFDMQQGFRKGSWTELMKPVVANLTSDDMLDLAAYAASKTP